MPFCVGSIARSAAAAAQYLKTKYYESKFAPQWNPKGNEKGPNGRREGGRVGRTAQCLMVKAVQKFHDKINAPRSSGQIGKDWPAGRPGGRKGEGRIGGCYQECILIITSDNDFSERFRGNG